MDGSFPTQQPNGPAQYNQYGPQYDQYQQNQPAKKGFKGTPENAKTKLCIRYMQGQCRYGDNCNFAHGDAELRHVPKQKRAPQTNDENADVQANSQPPQYSSEPAPLYGGPPHPGPYPQQSGPTQYGAAGPMPGPHPAYGQYAPPPANPMHHPAYGHPPPYSMPPQWNQAPRPIPPPLSPLHAPDQPPPGCEMDLWVQSGRPVQGPQGWVRYSTEQMECYYHNAELQKTTWEMPPEWVSALNSLKAPPQMAPLHGGMAPGHAPGPGHHPVAIPGHVAGPVPAAYQITGQR